MPNMVIIEGNPDFDPKDAAAKKLHAEIMKRPPIKVAEVTGKENVRASDGMYRIKRTVAIEAPAPQATVDEMGRNELKTMAASLGVTIEKATTAADLRAAVKEKLDGITLADDPEE